MAYVTFTDVIALAQQKLGDEAGELFTSAMLVPHAGSAHRDLCRLLQGITSPKVRITRAIRIPANTSSVTLGFSALVPFQALGFQSLVSLADRQEDRTVVISSLAGTDTDIVTVGTLTPHLLVVGQTIALMQTGWRWLDGYATVTTVPTTSSFTVRGTLAIGATSSGIVSVASEAFQPVGVVAAIDQWPAAPVGRISQVALTENGLTFWPCTTARQMRIVYDADGGDITGSTIIDMDDAKDFIAVVAGAYAASAKGATNKYQELSVLAFGESLNRSRPDGGLARALLQSSVRALQQRQYARPPFRGVRPSASVYPIF